MKSLLLILLLFITACTTSLVVPDSFVYKEISTPYFDLATWQKVKNPRQPYIIYIEGDGYAFNRLGQPTSDPTPKSHLMRERAFNDTSSNVVYLSRPCQYIKNQKCQQKHWTTARFAPEVIDSTAGAIKQIAGNNPIILIGYSGGAQVAGLVAVRDYGLNIKKIITISGNLEHRAWTDYHQIPPLNQSLSLADYQEKFTSIPQTHYVGEKDKVIPPHLTKQFIKNQNLIVVVPNATHSQGWENAIIH